MAKKRIRRSAGIAKHNIIPKHSKLSEKDKQELLQSYNITMRELPKILVDDPGMHGLEAKPGDIIKITRKSATAGESAFYRCVTNV